MSQLLCSDRCKYQVARSEKHTEDISRHHEANQWSTKAIRKQEAWRKRIKWSEKHIFWSTKDAKLVKRKFGHRTSWLLEVYLTTHRTCKNLWELVWDSFKQLLWAEDQNSPSTPTLFQQAKTTCLDTPLCSAMHAVFHGTWNMSCTDKQPSFRNLLCFVWY